MNRQAAKARSYALAYGANQPGLDNTDPDPFDALAHADHAGLMRDDDDNVHGIYERAGFNADTHVDSAFRNPCMIEAGSMMLSESDDSYLEV
jgi:hypothetical protein